jgi:hypothetical protein
LFSYEKALAYENFDFGLFYDHFAHMLWIVEHICQLDGTHSEFLCGVSNPFKVKVCCLFIIQNSHLLIEPFFDVVKCSLESVYFCHEVKVFSLSPFRMLTRQQDIPMFLVEYLLQVNNKMPLATL